MGTLRTRTIRLAHQHPELRPHLLPLLKTAVTGFHGSSLPGLQKLLPDPQDRKRMSSLGTWATSSRDHALIYGTSIYEVDIPDGKFLVAPTDNFNVFWFDEALVRKYLPMKYFPALFGPAGTPVLNYFKGTGTYPDLSTAKPKDQYVLKDLLDVEIPNLIFRDWGYLKDWRAKRITQGYDGIVWKNSGIDVGIGHPHDVYLVWDGLKVIRELTPEEVSHLINPRNPDARPSVKPPAPSVPEPPEPPVPPVPSVPKPPEPETITYEIRNADLPGQWLVIGPENGRDTGDTALMLALYKILIKLPNAKKYLRIYNDRIYMQGGSGATAVSVANKAVQWMRANRIEFEDTFVLR